MTQTQNLQIIKSLQGEPEYVLIPFAVYRALREDIDDELAGLEALADKAGEAMPFRAEDYVSNPVALARIKARTTQTELATRMGVTQAYVSKLEAQTKVTVKTLEKVAMALAPAKKNAVLKNHKRTA